MILQLGTLNESIVTPTDIYLCIKLSENYSIKVAEAEEQYVKLCAVWRSSKTQKIVYRTLNSRKDSLTSISLEMLTEDLPQLLQSLLVSVEQTISRVPFDELAFPKYLDDDHENAIQRTANDSGLGLEIENRQTVPGSNGSPKCGIKRREILTKNKPPQNRYTLKRISIKSDLEKKEASLSTLPSPTVTTSINTSNNMMPLFCLGGSFPHIDSDEDSGDDGSKARNERK